MIPIVGFAPDVDPSTPGVLTDVSNMVPTVRGMKGAPSPIDAGYSAFPLTVVGLAVSVILDGTRRIFAGTAAKLYELSAGVMTDRSRGAGYSLGAESYWTFAQFGNTTLAAADDVTLQASIPGGAFADIATAPKAKFVATASGFVMVANTNDTTFGDQSDRWRGSAYQDHTDWTPSVQTQAASGRLIDSPGPITGLRSLADTFVIYKSRAVFLGVYVGGDTIWQFQRVSAEVGAPSNSGIVDTGYAHFFLGNDDFYVFDGTRPVPIGAPVREWFYNDLNAAFSYRVQGAFDRQNARVWWFYPSRSSVSGAIDSAIVYHTKAQRWGHLAITAEVVAEYLSSGMTYDQVGTTYSTWDDLPTDISYDSPFWSAAAPVLAYVDTTHALHTFSGVSASSSATTGIIGDDQQYSTLTKVRPRFSAEPTASTADHMYDDEYGDSFTNGENSTLTSGKYDFLQSSRWHKLRMNFTGDVELIGYQPYLVPDGEE